MRKMLFAAAGFAVLTGAAGFAFAQNAPPERHGPHGIFQSDTNSDGVLTRQEFDAGRAADFARLDADRNGQLTREEMRAGRGERGEHRRGRHGGHRGEGMHHLANADANNDGNITREEFLARPNEMFQRLDANNDGVISTAERPQRGERHGERGDRRDRPNPDSDGNGTFSRAEFTAMSAHFFERLDANNDGRVTQEEAQAGRGPHRGDRN